MRIAQITDLHLNDFLAGKYGLDAKSNFAELLYLASAEPIDHIILSGDFGEPDQHAWILEELKAARIPFDVVLGNHDSFSSAASSGLAARTPASSAGYCYSAELEKIQQHIAPASIMQIRGEGETILTDSFDYGFLRITVEKDSIGCGPVMVQSGRQVQPGE